MFGVILFRENLKPNEFDLDTWKRLEVLVTILGYNTLIIIQGEPKANNTLCRSQIRG